jgi:hypothetical protein
MTRSTQVISGSVVVAIGMALVWFRAPVVPALLGAVAAGLVLYWRGRRAEA